MPYFKNGKLHESPWLPCYVAASVVPYAIGSGTPIEQYPGADWMGLIQPPLSFEAGIRNIHACMIGETQEQILLAVRATELLNVGQTIASIEDWLNDLAARPIGPEKTQLPGYVHEGFWQCWQALKAKGAQQALLELHKRTGKPIVICGYSKGAGVAPIIAMSLVQAGLAPDAIDGVVLFEAPRPGDVKFAQEYQVTFGEKTVRYGYKDDLIPHLPPSNETLKEIERHSRDRLNSVENLRRSQHMDTYRRGSSSFH